MAVCHVTGNGRSHTITIAEPAVAAHLAHGDTKGVCATHTTSSQTTTNAEKPKKPKKPKHSKPTHVRTNHITHAKPTHVAKPKQVATATHVVKAKHVAQNARSSTPSSHGNSGNRENGRGKK